MTLNFRHGSLPGPGRLLLPPSHSPRQLHKHRLFLPRPAPRWPFFSALESPTELPLACGQVRHLVLFDLLFLTIFLQRTTDCAIHAHLLLNSFSQHDF